MIKKSDYEAYFETIGLDSPQEQETVLTFLKELFCITINHLNGLDKKEVAYD